MDYKDLTRLLLKLIGAVLVFWYLARLPYAISAAFQAKLFLQGLLLHFAPAVIPLVLGVLIFMFPATITNKLIDGSKLETSQALVTNLELLALRLLGKL